MLVQYFEAMFGQLNTMALVPLADMVTRKGDAPMEGYVFFTDDEHLRDYMENVQQVTARPASIARMNASSRLPQWRPNSTLGLRWRASQASRRRRTPLVIRAPTK